MAVNTAPIFELTPVFTAVQFLPADTTTKKTFYTAPAAASAPSGIRIDSISVATNDTANQNIAFYINDPHGAGTDQYIGNVFVPLGSGYTTVARVECLQQLTTLGYLWIPFDAIIKCNMVATITAAKQTDLALYGGAYGA